jgi:signal transduction histidine kinase
LRNFATQQATIRKKTEGAGLGLALARKFVGLHEDTIAVQSKRWGSTFTVTLPEKFRRSHELPAIAAAVPAPQGR